MKKVINVYDKVCVMCRYWNNGMGSSTLKKRTGTTFDVDNTEEKWCGKTKLYRRALLKGCSRFEKSEEEDNCEKGSGPKLT